MSECIALVLWLCTQPQILHFQLGAASVSIFCIHGCIQAWPHASSCEVVGNYQNHVAPLSQSDSSICYNYDLKINIGSCVTYGDTDLFESFFFFSRDRHTKQDKKKKFLVIIM